MAGTIRGITVKIGGETSELGKALRDAENKSRDLQKELRKIDQDLKFNPGNIELLEQKQKLLTDQIEETRKKLLKLKEAEAQVEAQFNAGEIGEEQYRAFRREIISTENKLKTFETQLDQTDNEIEQSGKEMDDAAKSADDFGEAMEDAGDAAKNSGDGFTTMKAMLADLASNLIQNAASALIDLGKQALQVGMDFEKSMSNNEALFGATGAELEKLTETAKYYGSTTQFSATEAADALGYMALAGWDANKASQELGGVLELAAASGMGLAQASDMVTDYLSAFSNSSMTATEFADKLAYAQGHSNTTAEQLGEAYKNCAANLNAAGQDIDTVTALLGSMANQGLKGSEAGTALSAMMRDLTKKMKDGKVQIGDTAVAVQDSQGNYRSLTDILADVAAATDGMGDAERAAALQSTFTSDSIKGLNLILNEGVGSVQGFADELSSCDGSAAAMANTMQNNLSGKIAGLNSAMEGLGIALYEYFSGPLQSVVTIATNFINGITKALTPQKTELESFIADVRESNKQVQESIQHANETVTNAETRVAELSGYSEQFQKILGQCDQFNLVTLDGGKQVIVNAAGEIVTELGNVGEKVTDTEGVLGHFGDRGLNTSNIGRSSETAQNMIGYVETKANTVEERLNRFAERGFNTTNISQSKSVIIDIYNDAGQVIDTFEEKVGSSGEVEITHDLIDQGTNAIITAFNESTGSIQSFETKVTELQGKDLNLQTITQSFDAVSDSISTTYHITDEFTKIKIQHMVDTLGDSVQGLAGAWNAETGELTASKEQMEEWFDVAKEVAKYNALNEAIQEYADAYSQAYVTQVQAQSALSAALEEFNEEAGTSLKTWEEFQDYIANTDMVPATSAVAEAQVELEKANKSLDEAEEALETNGAALEEARDHVEDVISVTQEAKEATEGAADANDDLTEATEELTAAQQKSIDAFHDLTDKYDIDMARLQQNLNMTNEEFANWCDERVEEVKPIIDAYQDLLQKVTDSMHGFVTGIDTSGEEGSAAIDNMLGHLQEKTANLQTWVDNMKKLGEMAGKELPQGLYDQLLAEGPEKTAEAVQALVDAAENDVEKFNAIGKEYEAGLAIEASAETLVSYSSAGKSYEQALKEGFVGSREDWQQAVANSVKEGAQVGTAAAQEAGGEIGETMDSSMAESAEANAGQVSSASETVLEQAKEFSLAAAPVFRSVGEMISSMIGIGINRNRSAPVDKLKTVVNNMKTTINGEKTSFQLAGSGLTDSFASGIQNHGIQAYNAGRAVVAQAVNGLASYSAYSAGVTLMQTLINGVNSMSGVLSQTISNAVSNAVNHATSHIADRAITPDFIERAFGVMEEPNGLSFERSLSRSEREQAPDYTKMLEKIYKGIVENSDRDIVLDSGALVGSTIGKIDQALGEQYRKKARGM